MNQSVINPYEATSLGGVRRESPVPGFLKPSLWTIAALVVGAAATRLAPHWWNLTAVGAVCLFSGAYFERRWLAFVVPLAALAVSDVVLQTFVYPDHGPNYFKYVAFAATVPLGFLLRDRQRLAPVAAATIAASALFFLLTNFQVWLGGDGAGARIYPLTPAGLWACYVAAIPFSLNMLYGNLLFTGLLFGGMELARHRLPVRKRILSQA